jgi:hypothetical protein
MNLVCKERKRVVLYFLKILASPLNKS